MNKLYNTRRVDFRSRFTMSSALKKFSFIAKGQITSLKKINRFIILVAYLAFGCGSPASIINSNARATFATFSSND